MNVFIKKLNYVNIKYLFLFDEVKYLNITQLNADSVFLNKNFALLATYGVQVLKLKEFNLTNSQNVAIQQSTDFKTDNETTKRIPNCTFESSYFKIKNVISDSPLIIISSINYLIANSTFENIQSNSNMGSVLYLDNNKNVTIQNCQFQQNSVYNGGVILVNNTQQLSIENTIIINNTSIRKAGGVFLLNSTLKLEKSLISQNNAYIGGGIYYIGKQPFYFQENKIRNLHLTEKFLLTQYSDQIKKNRAIFYGQNVGSFIWKIGLNSISIEDSENQAVDLKQIDTLTFAINNFRSGTTIILNTFLRDDEERQITISKEAKYGDLQNKQDFIENFQNVRIEVKIEESSESQIYLSNSIIAQSDQYDFEKQLFKSDPLKIIGLPNNSVSIYLLSNKIYSQYTLKEIFQHSIHIKINFRECIEGEIPVKRDKILECKPCPEGFYSLFKVEDYQNVGKCLRCPISALRCKENKIELKTGYWRRDELSDNILYCENNPKNCIGSEEGNKYYCKEGFIGPLCESCDIYGDIWNEKYMKRQGYECKKCSEVSQYHFILPSIIFFLILLVYIIFSVNQSIKMAKVYSQISYFEKMGILKFGRNLFKNSSTSFYLKQLMHYFQIISLINRFNFQIPEFIRFVPEVVSSPLENIRYDFDCLLSKIDRNKLDIVFSRPLWILMVPLLLLLLSTLVCYVFQALKIIKQNRYYYYNGLIFIMVYMLPNIYSELSSVVSCQTIDGVSYIHKNSNYQCYTANHIKYSLLIILPGIVIWILFIPQLILYFLRKALNNNQFDKINCRFKYSFLYQDFKKKYYYWEFIKLYKKIVIVSIYNFFYEYHSTRYSLTQIILLGYLTLLQKMQPYQMIKQNKIDKQITLFLIVILNMNIMLNYNVESDLNFLYEIGKVMTMTLNLIVQISLLFLFIITSIMAKYHRKIYCFCNMIYKYIPLKFLKKYNKPPVNQARLQKTIRKIQNVVHNQIIKKQKNQSTSKNSQNIQLNKQISDKNDSSNANLNTISESKIKLGFHPSFNQNPSFQELSYNFKQMPYKKGNMYQLEKDLFSPQDNNSTLSFDFTRKLFLSPKLSENLEIEDKDTKIISPQNFSHFNQRGSSTKTSAKSLKKSKSNTFLQFNTTTIIDTVYTKKQSFDDFNISSYSNNYPKRISLSPLSSKKQNSIQNSPSELFNTSQKYNQSIKQSKFSNQLICFSESDDDD